MGPALAMPTKRRKKKQHPIGAYIDKVMRDHAYEPAEVYNPIGMDKGHFWRIRFNGCLPSRLNFLLIAAALHPNAEETREFKRMLMYYYDLKENPLLQSLFSDLFAKSCCTS